MSLRHVVCVACGLGLTLCLPAPARPGSFHSFEAGNEGWQVVSYPFRSHVAAPAMSALTWDGAVGNPAGSVRVGDVHPETGIAAPADHLGNQGSIYGDTLRFDILIRYSDNTTYPAVVLNGGTKSLYYDMPSSVVGAWETRVVPLSEAGWKVSGTFALATQSDFMDVLGNLVGVYIYTEWHTGTDDTSVDNIAMPVGGPVGVGAGPGLARGLRVDPVFPNPGGGPVEVSLAIREPGRVSVGVFDVTGRRIRALATGVFVAGAGRFAWDGTLESGEPAPSGIYFVRARTDAGEVAMRKIVRVR